MPNYLEILGNCFPGVEAYTAGNPTVYNDLIWVSPPVSEAELLASDCAQGTFVEAAIAPPSTVGGYHDILIFGDSGDVKNKFLNNGANNHKCVDSAPIALSSGEVVHVTVSTEDDADANFYIQIIKNAIKGGSGVFSDGIQIGTDVEKPVGSLDHVEKGLSGFSFAAGDRIAAYIKKGTSGGGKAKEPVVRLFIRYD